MVETNENNLEETKKIVPTPKKISASLERQILFAFVAINAVCIVVFILIGIRTQQPEVTIQPAVMKNQFSKADIEYKLPDYYSYLKDPSFSEWYATLKGIIIKKEKNIFTVAPISEKYGEKGKLTVSILPDAKPLQIEVPPQNINFYLANGTTPSNKPASNISYEEIPLNSIVRGTAGILYLNDQIHLIGVSFIVTPQ